MKNNAVVLSFLHRCFVLSTPLFCLSYTDVSVIILIRLICVPKRMAFPDVISDYFLGLIVVILFGGNEGTKKNMSVSYIKQKAYLAADLASKRENPFPKNFLFNLKLN